MSHSCAICEEKFECSGKPTYATKWEPCGCLQQLTADEEKGTTSLRFYCKPTCKFPNLDEEDDENEYLDDGDDGEEGEEEDELLPPPSS